MVVVIFIY